MVRSTDLVSQRAFCFQVVAMDSRGKIELRVEVERMREGLGGDVLLRICPKVMRPDWPSVVAVVNVGALAAIVEAAKAGVNVRFDPSVVGGGNG